MILKIARLLFLSVLIFYSTLFAQTDINKIENISLSPIPTFKENCARCHGDEGSAYGKNFANLSSDSLKLIIDDMMFGPGGLSPDEVEIAAMISYNKSLSENKPFASVENSKSFLEGKDKGLKISSSPHAKISIDNHAVKVDSTKGGWRLFYDPNKIKEIKITISRNDSSAFIDFPNELWTK